MASTPVSRYSLSFIAFIYCISFPCILSCKSSIAETPEKTDTTNKYLNPVFIPVFADPAVIRGDDGWFYAYGTEDNWSVNELHLIPILRSRDLVKWYFMNDAFTSKPTWKNNGMLWAPNVNKINGKYYMYYAYSLWGDSNPGIGLAISNTPLGPFNDYGKIFTSTEIGVENSIDPFFFQENGHNYLFWGSFRGIFGVELAPDGKSVSGEKFQIAGNAFEASYIYKRGAYYYFFGSVGSCCDGIRSSYHVAVARSSSIGGPYLDKSGNDIINSEGTLFIQGNSKFVGPGHNAEIITDDKGNDWFIYHAIERNNPNLPNGATRRPLMIDRIIWNDGWPTIKNNAPSAEWISKPVIDPF